jgi:biopolymer transport protein ExbB/biopolymer transport protein TolQ
MEFGPAALWESMGFIAKAVCICLLFMSILSLYISVERWLLFRKARRESLSFAKQATKLLGQNELQAAVDMSKKHKYSHVARVTSAGLIEFIYDTSAVGGATIPGHDVVEAAHRAVERETLITYSDLKRGIGLLATIATTAPFIGLFGTVVGIINAFRGMAMTGSGGIGAVSAGIAEALVTTALGLFVAIPAAWLFNSFTNALERFSTEMSNSSSELLDFFIKKLGAKSAATSR